jgi:hypothetical protein
MKNIVVPAVGVIIVLLSGGVLFFSYDPETNTPTVMTVNKGDTIFVDQGENKPFTTIAINSSERSKAKTPGAKEKEAREAEQYKPEPDADFKESETSSRARPDEPAKTIDRKMIPVTKVQKAQDNKPSGLEEYLNQISNPSISRTIRKGWKEDVLKMFVNGSVIVYEDKDGISKKHSVTGLLSLLLDIPHKIKVKDVLMDKDEKIAQMHIQMNLEGNWNEQ